MSQKRACYCPERGSSDQQRISRRTDGQGVSSRFPAVTVPERSEAFSLRDRVENVANAKKHLRREKVQKQQKTVSKRSLDRIVEAQLVIESWKWKEQDRGNEIVRAPVIECDPFSSTCERS